MNKTAIEKFAVWARQKLISEIKYKAGLIGITDKGICEALPQSTSDLQLFDIGTKEYARVSGGEIGQRNALVTEINHRCKTTGYLTAYNSVIEEVAYTWFNRLIAVRFMEVNDYLPSRIRVLSSENPAKSEPDIVTNPLDSRITFTDEEKDEIDILKVSNDLDSLFRMLFVKQCNELHEDLPELFEHTADYTELLLNISFTDKDGVVYHLTHDISEDDFNVEKEGQVEIIGWLYQFYNSELKDQTYAELKKNAKMTKEKIPAVTQLFTPDWVVRYMVENSLGRLWIEGHPNESLRSEWKYYLDEAEQEEEVKKQLEEIRKTYKNITPESIKFIDPSMGSGHILVYAFDVLMQIYESCGYTHQDAAKSIVENNLYGIDIDRRAYQLAYFAVMMKARSYNRRAFKDIKKCNLCAIVDTNSFNRDYLELFGELKETAKALANEFDDAKEYGSILNIKTSTEDIERLIAKYSEIKETVYDNFFDSERQSGIITEFEPVLRQAKALAQKYDTVVTNPPYMTPTPKQKPFVEKYYPDSKTDLFAVFIEKGISMTKKYGFNSMVTMQAWMFLSSYEKLRIKLLNLFDITNLMHMDNMVMHIAFGTAVTIIRNSFVKNYKGTYNQVLYKNIIDDGDERPFEFPVKENRFNQTSSSNFSKIPGSPVAYWVSEKFISIFNNIKLKNISRARRGLETGNNEKYLKRWYEVNFQNIDLKCKSTREFKKNWLPHNKGGEARNWYGNREYIVWYKNDAEEIRKSGNLNGEDVYCQEGITWTALTSGKNTFRYTPYGCTFDSNKGPLIVDNGDSIIFYLLGLFISPIVQTIVKIINPTLSLQNGDMDRLPIVIDKTKKTVIDSIVNENIDHSKHDWDSFETSWDFKKNPLI